MPGLWYKDRRCAHVAALKKVLRSFGNIPDSSKIGGRLLWPLFSYGDPLVAWPMYWCFSLTITGIFITIDNEKETSYRLKLSTQHTGHRRGSHQHIENSEKDNIRR